jgi:DNA-binding PadR family transcriptional regulator
MQVNGGDPDPAPPLTALEFHILLVLAKKTLHGYAMLKGIEGESGGAVSPEVGTLYRVLARMMSSGLVEETSAPASAPRVHRGRSRRYYRLTREGRALLKAEARRLASAVEIARIRAILPHWAEGSKS